jgi:5-methylcytosine-specific restriction protein A
MFPSLSELYAKIIGEPLLFGVPRAPEWRSLSREWLEEFPCCAVCEGTRGCVPHHKKPVHLYPQFELHRGNLVTMCPRCHLLLGHLNDWRSYNPDLDADVRTWRAKLLRRP